MMKAETHPADDTDGHRLFVLPLFCADITFHNLTSSGAPWTNPGLPAQRPSGATSPVSCRDRQAKNHNLPLPGEMTL